MTETTTMEASPKLRNEKLCEVIANYRRTKDEKYADEFVKEIKYFVTFLVSKMPGLINESTSFDDLCQIGVIGALKTLNGYDPNSRINVVTHLGNNIKWEIMNRNRSHRMHMSLIPLYRDIKKAEEKFKDEHGCQPIKEEILSMIDLRGRSPEWVMKEMDNVVNFTHFAGTVTPDNGQDDFQIDENSIADPVTNITPEVIAEIENDIQDLNQKMKKFLSRREIALFSRRNQGQQTLAKCGQSVGVTKERARQIVLAATQKMRYAYGLPNECSESECPRCHKIFPSYPLSSDIYKFCSKDCELDIIGRALHRVKFLKEVLEHPNFKERLQVELDPKERSVFVMRYIDHAPYEYVGKQLDMTAFAVRAISIKAFHKMRLALGFPSGYKKIQCIRCGVELIVDKRYKRKSDCFCKSCQVGFTARERSFLIFLCEDRTRVTEAKDILTEEEIESVYSYIWDCKSQQEVAEESGLKKSTAREHLNTAWEKLRFKHGFPSRCSSVNCPSCGKTYLWTKRIYRIREPTCPHCRYCKSRERTTYQVILNHPKFNEICDEVLNQKQKIVLLKRLVEKKTYMAIGEEVGLKSPKKCFISAINRIKIKVGESGCESKVM